MLDNCSPFIFKSPIQNLQSPTFTVIRPFVCLFVCFGFIVSLKNFSLIWRHQHYRWRAAYFDLGSTLMAISWSSPRTRDTPTFCWAFSSGAVFFFTINVLSLTTKCELIVNYSKIPPLVSISNDNAEAMGAEHWP